MKILFVENRYTTQVLERVAGRLARQGHEIAWLVQNHHFQPAGWRDVHVIPYPRGARACGIYVAVAVGRALRRSSGETRLEHSI